MIPTSVEVLTPTEDVIAPSKTYKIEILDENAQVEDVERISGYADGLEAIKQSIYLILNVERYKYIIYSWDYGVELSDLFGKPMPFVLSEVERRITEALMQDDRIIGVSDFEFTRNRNKLYVTFNVRTNVGVISSETEVRV